ncbi:hypothetical protein SynA1825c_00645 [Synechococcus sp. A18-25c]|nr:hypothetical protein SynA1825c_00645 [Synechococcus sp. A18-25c]
MEAPTGLASVLTASRNYKKSAPAGMLEFQDSRAFLIRRRWSEIHRAARAGSSSAIAACNKTAVIPDFSNGFDGLILLESTPAILQARFNS